MTEARLKSKTPASFSGLSELQGARLGIDTVGLFQLHLIQRLTTWGNFSPRGHLATSRDNFDCHDWGGDATGI